jgi:hypothetical protein
MHQSLVLGTRPSRVALDRVGLQRTAMVLRHDYIVPAGQVGRVGS